MNKHKAFTIVELLTSIVIIALLMGILLPSLSMIRRSAKEAAQKAQISTIDMALEAFKQDYGDYPPSDYLDPLGLAYCGAQKLAEALLGWDMMGFDPNTVWRRDGYTGTGIPGGPGSYDPTRFRGDATLYERKGPYLEVAKTNVFRIKDLYNNYGPFDPCNFVICDVFGVKKVTIAKPGGITINTKAGTPILYYKANTNYKSLSCPFTSVRSIYNYYDNLDLLNLNILPDCSKPHRLINQPPGTGRYFCNPEYKIVDQKVPALAPNTYWPNRPDTYILISAGADHEFGTSDDILNF